MNTMPLALQNKPLPHAMRSAFAVPAVPMTALPVVPRLLKLAGAARWGCHSSVLRGDSLWLLCCGDELVEFRPIRRTRARHYIRDIAPGM